MKSTTYLTLIIGLGCLIGSQSVHAMKEPYMIIASGLSRFTGYTLEDLEAQYGKVFAKNEKTLLKKNTFINQKKCEKFCESQSKWNIRFADKTYSNPTKLGNFPNSGSVWRSQTHRFLGQIRLTGCPGSSKIKMDYALAIKHFEEGAASFDEESMYQLGLMYFNGLGVEKNEIRGIELIKDAAAEWSSGAHEFLKNSNKELPVKNKHQTKMIIAYRTRSDNI